MTTTTFFSHKAVNTQDWTSNTHQLEHGFHSDFLTVYINQLGLRFQRTLRCNLYTCGVQECFLMGITSCHPARPHMACSSRIHQQLSDVRLFPHRSNFVQHRNPLDLIVCVLQAVQITSTAVACIVWLSLLPPRAVQREMTNHFAIVVSSFLLVVSVLGFCAFPLSFLVCLALLTFFTSPCWLDINSSFAYCPLSPHT